MRFSKYVHKNDLNVLIELWANPGLRLEYTTQLLKSEQICKT